MGTHNQEKPRVNERTLQARCDHVCTQSMELMEQVRDVEARLAAVLRRLAAVEDVLHIPHA